MKKAVSGNFGVCVCTKNRLRKFNRMLKSFKVAEDYCITRRGELSICYNICDTGSPYWKYLLKKIYAKFLFGNRLNMYRQEIALGRARHNLIVDSDCTYIINFDDDDQIYPQGLYLLTSPEIAWNYEMVEYCMHSEREKYHGTFSNVIIVPDEDNKVYTQKCGNIELLLGNSIEDTLCCYPLDQDRGFVPSSYTMFLKDIYLRAVGLYEPVKLQYSMYEEYSAHYAMALISSLKCRILTPVAFRDRGEDSMVNNAKLDQETLAYMLGAHALTIVNFCKIVSANPFKVLDTYSKNFINYYEMKGADRVRELLASDHNMKLAVSIAETIEKSMIETKLEKSNVQV